MEHTSGETKETQMLKYSETTFNIALGGNVLTFSGTLEKFDYSDIDAFLRTVDQSLSSEICNIDLTNLHYLNSSGLKTLVTFMLKSSRKFEIRINADVTWQTENIPPLTHLRPGRMTFVA